jgi:hypothetical protein
MLVQKTNDYQFWLQVPISSDKLSIDEIGVDRTDVDPVEVGHRPHLILFGPDGYLNEVEIRTYLTKAESRRAQPIEYLGISAPAGYCRLFWVGLV